VKGVEVIEITSFPIDTFAVKHLAPGGPALIEPHVAGGGAGYLIAEPHVGELMGIKVFICQPSVDASVRVCDVADMLHGSQGRADITDTGPGVGPETALVKREDILEMNERACDVR